MGPDNLLPLLRPLGLGYDPERRRFDWASDQPVQRRRWALAAGGDGGHEAAALAGRLAERGVPRLWLWPTASLEAASSPAWTRVLACLGGSGPGLLGPLLPRQTPLAKVLGILLRELGPDDVVQLLMPVPFLVDLAWRRVMLSSSDPAWLADP